MHALARSLADAHAHPRFKFQVRLTWHALRREHTAASPPNRFDGSGVGDLKKPAMATETFWPPPWTFQSASPVMEVLGSIYAHLLQSGQPGLAADLSGVKAAIDYKFLPATLANLSTTAAEQVFTAKHSGKKWDTSFPPPYPCLRCREMHWHKDCPRAKQNQDEFAAPSHGGSPPTDTTSPELGSASTPLDGPSTPASGFISGSAVPVAQISSTFPAAPHSRTRQIWRPSTVPAPPDKFGETDDDSSASCTSLCSAHEQLPQKRAPSHHRSHNFGHNTHSAPASPCVHNLGQRAPAQAPFNPPPCLSTSSHPMTPEAWA